jgi:hypothetical protein
MRDLCEFFWILVFVFTILHTSSHVDVIFTSQCLSFVTGKWFLDAFISLKYFTRIWPIF